MLIRNSILNFIRANQKLRINGFSRIDDDRTRYYIDKDYLNGEEVYEALLQITDEDNFQEKLTSIIFYSSGIRISLRNNGRYNESILFGFDEELTEEKYFQLSLVNKVISDLEYEDVLEMLQYYNKLITVIIPHSMRIE